MGKKPKYKIGDLVLWNGFSGIIVKFYEYLLKSKGINFGYWIYLIQDEVYEPFSESELLQYADVFGKGKKIK